MSGAVEIGLRAAQMQVFRSDRRFRVLVAGRRFGKTHLAMVEMLRAACGVNKRVWYVAPSYRQAKQIAWERLKEVTRPWWAERPQEAELTVRLRWGGTIALKGADQYDSLRGPGLDFVVLDEYASMRRECWTEVLRPALSDRRGGALFIGTPRSCDHLYDQFEYAKTDADWAAFRFSTREGGNVSEEELKSAAREMDERLWRQEFEASFDAAGASLAYVAFAREGNVGECQFRPGEPLIWALDFNVNPMCSVLAQRVGDAVHVIDEMVLDDAHTEMACDALVEKTQEWRRWWGELTLHIYGDASGFQRRTAGAMTDWRLIREYMTRWRGDFAPDLRAPRANGAVRDRVNAVNSRLCSHDGVRRLVVDPKCKELIRDLETVRWKQAANGQVSGELDKGDRKRTHISDALGYYLVRAFPIRGW